MCHATFPMPAEDLVAIDRAAAAFRAAWSRTKSPPWPAPFDFTLTDVKTIDYMDYEGIEFPDCGNDGAVLIVAEFVRRAAKLQWFMSYRGEWILSESPNDSRIAVAPRARYHELECGRGQQFGNFSDLLAELALACIPAEHGADLLPLFPQGSEYFDRLQRQLDRFQHRKR